MNPKSNDSFADLQAQIHELAEERIGKGVRIGQIVKLKK
jgi:hypothetical protein